MTLTLVETAIAFGGEQRKYRHDSAVLQCEMTFSLYLPSNQAGEKIPLIWWLSGLTCTDDNFSQKSGFQRLANHYQVAVMIPDTSPTQAPWSTNYQMYDYLTEELPAIAAQLVPNFSGEESVMGHSMGGHGALVLGLRNPARFTAISAFAPILNPMQVPWGVKAFTTYLGADTNAWKSWDATELIKETTLLPILITQGSKDGFYEKQLKETTFLKNAEEARNNIQYQMKEGYDHSYFFISTFLEEHFAFHLSHL